MSPTTCKYFHPNIIQPSPTRVAYPAESEQLSIHTPLCHPSHLPRPPSSSFLRLLSAPRHNYSRQDKRQALACRDIKEPRIFVNEGALAASCSLCLSAAEQCPWPSCFPFPPLPPLFSPFPHPPPPLPPPLTPPPPPLSPHPPPPPPSPAPPPPPPPPPHPGWCGWGWGVGGGGEGVGGGGGGGG